MLRSVCAVLGCIAAIRGIAHAEAPRPLGDPVASVRPLQGVLTIESRGGGQRSSVDVTQFSVGSWQRPETVQPTALHAVRTSVNLDETPA